MEEDSAYAEAVVLNMDFRNFTCFTAKNDIELVSDVLQKFFKYSSNLVYKSGGRIDKFLGDGYLAYWLSGSSVAKSVSKACHVVFDSVAYFKSEFAEVADLIFPAYTLYSGKLKLQRLGGDFYSESTILGSCVNIACKMQYQIRRTKGIFMLPARLWNLVADSCKNFIQEYLYVYKYERVKGVAKREKFIIFLQK